MSTFIEAATDQVLEVDAATAQLSALGKDNDGFLHDAATVLTGLYNNRSLLAQVMLVALRQAMTGGSAFYSPQSFLLSSGKFACGRNTFTLRGNIWFPPSLAGLSQRLEDYVYSYGNCHDHNFDFLTIGYSGPGYETDMYEYDHDAVLGMPGEQVDLKFVQRATLAPGRILHFRKSKDVHVQRYPESTSISLNILMPDEDLAVRPQYEFDVESQRISSLLYANSMFDVSMADMVGQLGCTEALPAMQERMGSSPMWQHRFAAINAMVDAGVLNRAEAAAQVVLLDLPGGSFAD